MDFKSRDKLNAKQKIFLLEVLFCYRGRAESSEKIRTQLNSDDRTHLFIYNYVYFYDNDLDIHPVELTEKAWNFIEKNMTTMVVLPASPTEQAFKCLLDHLRLYLKKYDTTLFDLVRGQAGRRLI